MITEDMIPQIKNVLIAVLAFGFVLALWTIKRLKQSLKEEVQKRLCPVLNLEMETNGRGLMLRNESASFAKYICIDDVQMVLDYDFKRTVSLKFDTVNFLNPLQKTGLRFQGHTSDRKLTDDESQGLLAHIPNASFELTLRYANLENQKFISRIRKDKNAFTVIDNQPL